MKLKFIDYDGSNIDCSDCRIDQFCRPIFYSNYSTCSDCARTSYSRCMEFVRSSASFPDVYCTIGQREQLNIQVEGEFILTLINKITKFLFIFIDSIY